MAPTIFTDANGKAKLIIGGAGGTTITTGISYVSEYIKYTSKKTIKHLISDIHSQSLDAREYQRFN